MQLIKHSIAIKLFVNYSSNGLWSEIRELTIRTVLETSTAA